jgi:hypothetical protein
MYRQSPLSYGVVSIVSGTMAIAGPILAQAVVSESNLNDYLYLYLSGTLLTVIALITGLFFKEIKFEYSS